MNINRSAAPIIGAVALGSLWVALALISPTTAELTWVGTDPGTTPSPKSR